MDIIRAKDIIRRLAEGIDPLTGELLPDDCICNQADIIRALYTVLDELSEKAVKAADKPSNHGKPWTKGEEDELIAQFDSGMKMASIAAQHSRSRGAIESRLLRLGKIEPTHTK